MILGSHLYREGIVFYHCTFVGDVKSFLAWTIVCPGSRGTFRTLPSSSPGSPSEENKAHLLVPHSGSIGLQSTDSRLRGD